MKENSFRIRLGKDLGRHSKKSSQRLWKDLSKDVLGSRKNRPSVNVAEISRNSKEGERVVVGGKVLGAGSIDHKVTVAAYSFSQGAKMKIKASGGTCMNLREFMETSTNVKDVKVIA